MKIAFIRKNYTPYGGAENYLRLVCKGLQAQGNEVHIFSANKWTDSKLPVHEIRTVKKPSFLSNMLFALNSRDTLRKETFDCIFSFERTFYQDIYRAGDGCHREWLDRRRAVEPFYKNMSFSLNPHHLTMLYLERQCLLNSKLILANSMMVKKDILRHYSLPEGKIKVIYNGVDLERFYPMSAEEKARSKSSLGIKGDKAILFVGADFKRKGLATLLNAFSLLDIGDKKLIVAGKKAMPQYFKMAKKLRIDKNVVFCGPVKEIEKLYAAADLFVLPTIYDPFSNAALEAMAAGIPVITTSSNGASEIISNGVDGFVINNPLDANAFAGKISIALVQAEDMGERARSKAEGFSIEKALDGIIDTISDYRGRFGS